jgi:quercetin dioxygenase-like cupin family protein
MTELEKAATKGEGYAVANLSDLGDGPGFRKIRKALGVTAFGVNAIVLPPTYETGRHYHDEQEELYFLHSGRIAIEFGDDSTHELDVVPNNVVHPGLLEGWGCRSSHPTRRTPDEDPR